MGELELQPVTPFLEEAVISLGGGSAIDTGRFSVSIADRPIAVTLPALAFKLGKPIPADLELYRQFSTWVVPNRVGVIRRSGMAEAMSVGIECEYMNGERTCTIVSLLPSPQFVLHGTASGTLKCEGNLAFSGETLPLDGDAGPVRITEAGIAFGASPSAQLSASFMLNVITPYISAVGIGSSRAEWRFERHDRPLFGRDIETWSVVVVPKRQRELAMRMRAHITLRTAFFPTRHQSAWQDVTCRLAD